MKVKNISTRDHVLDGKTVKPGKTHVIEGDRLRGRALMLSRRGDLEVVHPKA